MCGIRLNHMPRSILWFSGMPAAAARMPHHADSERAGLQPEDHLRAGRHGEWAPESLAGERCHLRMLEMCWDYSCPKGLGVKAAAACCWHGDV